jgi:hypothetical protein
VACPVSVQEQLRGRPCRSFPFGRRPYAGSKVQMTRGRKVHSSRRGGVLSPRTPIASGMALQCPGWCRGGGDGRTGPMVTEEIRLTGPTSRHCPGRARNRRPSPFRGFRRPPSRVHESVVRKWVAQCQGADTGLTAQCRTVAGMASPGGLAEQRRDTIPKCVRGAARRGFVFDLDACMCQNIKCSCRGSMYGGGEPVRASSEAETHSRGRPALERGGASPEGVSSPRARRNLTRGGILPSSEAESCYCGVVPLERSGVSPEGGWG